MDKHRNEQLISSQEERNAAFQSRPNHHDLKFSNKDLPKKYEIEEKKLSMDN